MSYLVGARLKITVPVRDHETNDPVDPATFAFHVRPPTGSEVDAAVWTWASNTNSWTDPDPDPGYASVSKGVTGSFSITLTIPYDNDAAGRWTIGWKTTANGSGLGEGSGEATILVNETKALPPA